jgi:hypothetical protein
MFADEHAREATAVGVDRVQHLAVFGDARAALSGNTGVTDRPFGVRADVVRGGTRSQGGPDTPTSPRSHPPPAYRPNAGGGSSVEQRATAA